METSEGRTSRRPTQLCSVLSTLARHQSPLSHPVTHCLRPNIPWDWGVETREVGAAPLQPLLHCCCYGVILSFLWVDWRAVSRIFSVPYYLGLASSYPLISTIWPTVPYWWYRYWPGCPLLVIHTGCITDRYTKWPWREGWGPCERVTWDCEWPP